MEPLEGVVCSTSVSQPESKPRLSAKQDGEILLATYLKGVLS